MKFDKPLQLKSTQEEIEEAEKEIYMKGRAMRVNETSEQYRVAREELREKKKAVETKENLKF